MRFLLSKYCRGEQASLHDHRSRLKDLHDNRKLLLPPQQPRPAAPG